MISDGAWATEVFPTFLATKGRQGKAGVLGDLQTNGPPAVATVFVASWLRGSEGVEGNVSHHL